MARQVRGEYPGAYQHVIISGDWGTIGFDRAKDYEIFIDNLLLFSNIYRYIYI